MIEYNKFKNTTIRISKALKVYMEEVVEQLHCPKTYGFEGHDTFSECNECVYCETKQLLEEINNE